MLEKDKISLRGAAELQGDVSALAEALGAAELQELARIGAPVELQHVRNLAELRGFLQKYISHVLVRSELRTIYRAYQHATRGQVRELIALDTYLHGRTPLRGSGKASQFVGRAQLKKLRALRDQRLVQRYLKAVEQGEAEGWHTVVFGLVLALFSLPLRQGLLHYATQTLNGFIQSAKHLDLRQSDCAALFSDIAAQLPKAIESIVKGESVELRSVK
jgi:urease accessory protein UreF